MENMDNNISSTGFKPLFIQEEATEPERNTGRVQREHATSQPGLSFTGTQLNPSALIKPYLQEMDDLLKSCEDLTGIPFGTHFSEGYTETSLSETTDSRVKREETIESYQETSGSSHAYLSTNYMDTHMDGAQTEEQGHLQGAGTNSTPHQTEMPVTSAGNKLGNAMVQYEGQLLGMLAMLESCMEETGMDFEPQDWGAEAGQEYVHISKNPQPYRGTTLVPIQQESTAKSESQHMQFESWAFQHAELDEVSKDSGKESTVGSTADHCQQNPLSVDLTERLERSVIEDQAVFNPLFSVSMPSQQLACDEDEPMYCEGTGTQHMCGDDTMETKKDTFGPKVVETKVSTEESQDPMMDCIDPRTGMDELGQVGTQMEQYIQDVQVLVERRKQLLVEVLELRGNKSRMGLEDGGSSNEEQMTEEQVDSKMAELMEILKSEEAGRREERKKERQHLREERAEEESQMWKINLERQGLQEEVRELRRTLFVMVRDCTHSQASLNHQRREVELLKRDEEKLQAMALQLTEEICQLRSAHQQQVLELQTKLQASSSQSLNTQEQLTECRRQSCGDIQQYLQGGLKALENRYEPVMLALLKRREAAADGLVKAKEQNQDLKAQLSPLREEIQRLMLQRACLEERLKLICIHHKEDIGQYKETVSFLEERGRELKTELNIQKRKAKEMEETKDNLTQQLQLYRDATEDHNDCDHQEEM